MHTIFLSDDLLMTIDAHTSIGGVSRKMRLVAGQKLWSYLGSLAFDLW